MKHEAYEPLLVKVEVAAKMLGFSDKKSVYGLIRSGQLKARKVNGRYAVNVSSIKAFAGE